MCLGVSLTRLCARAKRLFRLAGSAIEELLDGCGTVFNGGERIGCVVDKGQLIDRDRVGIGTRERCKKLVLLKFFWLRVRGDEEPGKGNLVVGCRSFKNAWRKVGCRLDKIVSRVENCIVICWHTRPVALEEYEGRLDVYFVESILPRVSKQVYSLENSENLVEINELF